MLIVTTSQFNVKVEQSENNPLAGKCPLKYNNDICSPRISSISSEGELIIQFPFPIKAYEKGFYQNISQSLFLQLITDTKSYNTIKSWTVIDFKPQILKLQLTFNNSKFL